MPEKGKNEWRRRRCSMCRVYLLKEREDYANIMYSEKKWISNTMPKRTRVTSPPPFLNSWRTVYCVVRAWPFFVWRSECRHRLEMLIRRPFPSLPRSRPRLPPPSPSRCSIVRVHLIYACAPNTPLPSIDREGRREGDQVSCSHRSLLHPATVYG